MDAKKRDHPMSEASKPHSISPDKRIEGLRNLRKGYDLVAAIGFWKELHGEDIIEEYASLFEQLETAVAERDRLRTAFDQLDHAIGDLDDFSENVSHGLKVSSPASSPSTLDSSIDIEGAETGWTGAPDPASVYEGTPKPHGIDCRCSECSPASKPWPGATAFYRSVSKPK